MKQKHTQLHKMNQRIGSEGDTHATGAEKTVSMQSDLEANGIGLENIKKEDLEINSVMMYSQSEEARPGSMHDPGGYVVMSPKQKKGEQFRGISLLQLEYGCDCNW